MDSFLTLLLHQIQRDERRPPPTWTHHSRIPAARWKWLRNECQTPSDFDALQLRQQLLRSPTAVPHYATCAYGAVTVVAEPPLSPMEDIPWNLWGRILRLFHGTHRTPFSIYFLASPSLRTFPASSREPIRPQHINGGYTYPCRPDTIVIYRAEDATRVLLHELQHASCLDKQEKGIDHVEAETEAWAELLYTAFLSRGHPARWRMLWARQWAWLTAQNRKVSQHLRASSSDNPPYPFPWRYTLGKEDVLRRWGLMAVPSTSRPTASLRLTPPPLPEQQREQGVRLSSVVL